MFIVPHGYQETEYLPLCLERYYKIDNFRLRLRLCFAFSFVFGGRRKVLEGGTNTCLMELEMYWIHYNERITVLYGITRSFRDFQDFSYFKWVDKQAGHTTMTLK